MAQSAVREVLGTGEIAIDATAGNGHDTLFLARIVGATGTVWSCDLQETAIAATRKLLGPEPVPQVRLCHQDHAGLAATLPASSRGRVGAVMFNLGYLPGGDKSVTTSANSTRAALASLASFLRPGGVLTVVAYPGHAGGEIESGEVDTFAASLPADLYEVSVHVGPTGKAPSPRVTVIRRLPTGTA